MRRLGYSLLEFFGSKINGQGRKPPSTQVLLPGSAVEDGRKKEQQSKKESKIKTAEMLVRHSPNITPLETPFLKN